MLLRRNFLSTLTMLSLFFSVHAYASDNKMTSVLEATEKLLEKDLSTFFAKNNQIELLMFMQKHGDTDGIKRLIPKLSSYNEKTKEFGTFTHFENQISLALVYLGEKKEALQRLEKGLMKAKTLLQPNRHSPSMGYYSEMIGQYFKLGGRRGLEEAKKFVYQVAKSPTTLDQAYQIYLSMALMWVDVGEIKLAQRDFKEAASLSLKKPLHVKSGPDRTGSLITVASYQGQAGLFEDMAETIGLIDTTDDEDIRNAWDTIKATIDLRAKKTAQ